MHVEPHFALGWLLANSTEGDRRFRAVVTIAAVAPDIDGVVRVFSEKAFADWHHVLGHNLLLSLLVTAAGVWLCKGRRLKALVLTQAAFYVHYFGDYFFTRWPMEFWWPFSNKMYSNPHAVNLGHPINTAFVYAALALMVLIAFWRKRTPLELISPALDDRVCNLLFRRRPLKCGVCGGRANERCAECGEPVCLRHGRLMRRLRVRGTCCGPSRSPRPESARSAD